MPLSDADSGRKTRTRCHSDTLFACREVLRRIDRSRLPARDGSMLGVQCQKQPTDSAVLLCHVKPLPLPDDVELQRRAR